MLHRRTPFAERTASCTALPAAKQQNGAMAADEWHPPLSQGHAPVRHIKASEVTADTAQTPGMQRFAAISGRSVGSDKLWMGRTHVAASTASGDHHHGESETAIYIVSGTPRFVFWDGEKEVALLTEPGDYIFVPPFTPHREENPSEDNQAVVVIARSTQEAIVVNLPSLRA
jgi:uncharacterized RmlC-like cupin family protein